MDNHSIDVQSRIATILADFKIQIDIYGLAIMGVGNSHVYSIGMAKRGLPDLICTCNIGLDLTHQLFMDLNAHLVAGGAKVGPVRLENWPRDIYLMPIAMDTELVDQYVTQNDNFYKRFPNYAAHGEVTFLQVYIPDPSGLFPFDDGYSNKSTPQKRLKLDVHKLQ